MIRNHLKESLSKQIKILEAARTEKMIRSILVHEDAKPTLAKFFHTVKKMWQSCSRHEETLKKKYDDWLSDAIQILTCDAEILSTQSKRTDRPSLEFSAMSGRPKRRKIEEFRTSNTTEELAYAIRMSLRSSGQLLASNVVKDVTSTSPRVSKYVTAFSEVERTLSDDAALSVLVEHKFSKRAYQKVKKVDKENNCKLYLSYNNVLQAKKRCYPCTSIMISQSCAEIKLQDLLDYVTKRILFLQREVISTLTVENVKNMHLICKWSCDRSYGQSVYKQKFTEDGKSGENVFFISLVSLQLVYKDHESDTEIIVWKNSRPIRLQFLHENVESTVNEVGNIKQQMVSLVPFTTQVHGMKICVKYNMTFTMIDSKICNAVSGTKSTLRCYLYGVTFKDFNNIDKILQKKVIETNLRLRDRFCNS